MGGKRVVEIFDIYIAYVSWGDDGKKRPVLVLERGISSVTTFAITTQHEEKSESIRSRFFKILEWQKAGLNHESFIDTNNTVTLPHSSIAQPIGKLSEFDIQRFLDFIVNIEAIEI